MEDNLSFKSDKPNSLKNDTISQRHGKPPAFLLCEENLIPRDNKVFRSYLPKS
jgi:hypothetical protein